MLHIYMKKRTLKKNGYANNINLLVFCVLLTACNGTGQARFKPGIDLLSLHYDHASDKDDGHSAAADRTILQSMFGIEWIKKHVLVVSGAYGKNANIFNVQSNDVMDAVWKGCGGWLDAHTNRQGVVNQLSKRWLEVLVAGGDVWVKEGGQSDLTAEVVKNIRQQFPHLDTAKKIRVVQHSLWNEEHTTATALTYVKKNTHYIKIGDANPYLGKDRGNDAFVKAAIEHPVFGNIWSAAFDYYNPKKRLDFSDTGELMYILGIGQMNLDDFRQRYLSAD